MNSPSPPEPDLAVGRVLDALRAKAFPPSTVPHPAYYGAFDVCKEFVADTPTRLVVILDDRYFDPAQEDSADASLSPYAVEADFEKRFGSAVAAAEAHLGRPGTRDTGAAFDPDFHSFDSSELVYWIDGDRALLIHCARQYGDGDMQLLLCACAVPAASR